MENEDEEKCQSKTRKLVFFFLGNFGSALPSCERILTSVHKFVNESN